MPIIDGVGRSEHTKAKQESIRTIMDVHTRIVKKILSKPKTRSYADLSYLYLDMNSGPGNYEDINGSPLVFLNTALENKINFTAILSEINSKHCKKLSQNLGCDKNESYLNMICSMLPDSNVFGYKIGPDSLVVVCNENNVNTLESVKTLYTKHYNRKPYGMVYVDPNNHEARFKELSSFFSHPSFRQLDVMFHISGTTIKRLLSKNVTDRLSDSISGINKKFWLIKKPETAWDWTFLLGTNWVDFPEFDSIDFVSVDSAKGQFYLDQVNNTRKELAQLPYIETTNLTSRIPCLGLSGL